MSIESLFSYRIENNGAVLTDYAGRESVVRIPDTLDAYPIIGIDRKTFMGKKDLLEIICPNTLSMVGDFAFAKCALLKTITFLTPLKALHFGRKVFDGCDNLNSICVGCDTPDDFAYLAATLASKLPSVSLLSDEDLGSDAWLGRWDLTLRSFACKNDMDGYEQFVVCGEEDLSYDDMVSVEGEAIADLSQYKKNVSKNKVALCMLRLLHHTALTDEMRLFYEEYIASHGFKEEMPSSYELLKETYAEHEEYIRLYLSIMNPCTEDVMDMLSDIGTDLPLLRKELILYNEKHQDAFASLFI